MPVGLLRAGLAVLTLKATIEDPAETSTSPPGRVRPAALCADERRGAFLWERKPQART
jgi:hypothetical protein